MWSWKTSCMKIERLEFIPKNLEFIDWGEIWVRKRREDEGRLSPLTQAMRLDLKAQKKWSVRQRIRAHETQKNGIFFLVPVSHAFSALFAPPRCISGCGGRWTPPSTFQKVRSRSPAPFLLLFLLYFNCQLSTVNWFRFWFQCYSCASKGFPTRIPFS